MVVKSLQWWRCLFARRELCFINGEPSLDEILNEPIVRFVMRRDGVAPQEVKDLIKRAQERPVVIRTIWPFGSAA